MFDPRQRVEQDGVVAGLGHAEREDLAPRGVVEDESQRGVAAVREEAGDGRPDQMHVDAERRGGGGRGEPPLGCGGPRHPSRVTRRGVRQEAQVPDRGQLLEVLGEERVGGVVAGGPSPEPLEQVVRQELPDVVRRRRGGHGASCCIRIPAQ